MGLVEGIAIRFSSSVLGYLRLWEYIDRRAKLTLTGGSTHRPSTAKEFHDRLFRGDIKHGDRVIWDRIYLSDWLPRVAGGCSLLVAAKKWAEEEYVRLPASLAGVQAWSLRHDRHLPPLGAVRLPVQADRPRALGGFTALEYSIEQGVVFSVSEAVYQMFLSKRAPNQTVEATLESFVELQDTTRTWPLPLHTASDDISSVVLDRVARGPHYMLRVDSPVGVAFRSNDTHPPITAWTVRRFVHRSDTYLLRTLDIDQSALRTEVVPIKRGEVDYQFLTIGLQDESIGELSAAADVARIWPVGIGALHQGAGGSNIVRTFASNLDPTLRNLNPIDELEIVCAYDGRSPFLPSSYPISIDLRQSTHHSDGVLNVVTEIENIERHGR